MHVVFFSFLAMFVVLVMLRAELSWALWDGRADFPTVVMTPLGRSTIWQFDFLFTNRKTVRFQFLMQQFTDLWKSNESFFFLSILFFCIFLNQ